MISNTIGRRGMMGILAILALAIVAVAVPHQATSAEAEPPASLVDAAKADLGERTETDPGDIVLRRAEPVTWSDGCLGAAEPGEFCIQVLVDGWVLWLSVADAGFRYHTDTAEQARFASGPFPIAQIDDAPLPGGATPRAPGFVGELPEEGGVAIVTWSGGSIDELTAAAPAAISFWVTAEGRFVGYVRGAPAFVNAEFFALFPGEQLPADTHMIVVLPRTATADFEETGNVVRDSPGLPPGVWHLVYEAPGAPALTVALEFTAQSECLLATGEPFSCDEIEVGTRASFEGRFVAEDTVRVLRLRAVETEPATMSVEVFFLDEERYATGDDPFVVGVEREVTIPAVATGALNALFAGPTPDEEAEGLRLVASEATGAQVIQLADGVAHVQLLGGCDSMGATFTVANLIIPTLTQFDTVDWVKIYDPEGATGQPAGLVHSIPACLEP